MHWALSDMHTFQAILFRCQLNYNITEISTNNLVIITCSANKEVEDLDLTFSLHFSKVMVTSMYHYTLILVYIFIYSETWVHASQSSFKISKQTEY